MCCRFCRWIVLLIALTVSGAVMDVSSVVAADDSAKIDDSETMSSWYVGAPVTDGQYVVWHAGSISVHAPCHLVMGAAIVDRTPFQIANYCRGSFAIDNGLVVWTTVVGDSDGDNTLDVAAGVFLKDLATAEEYTLATDVGDSAWGIAIEGNDVAWIQSPAGADEAPEILYRPHGPFVEPEVVRHADPGLSISNLIIRDGWIYWMEQYIDQPYQPTTIYRWQPGGDPESVENTADISWFDVIGERLVYLSGEWLSSLIPETFDYEVLATHIDGAVSTDGRYVFWSVSDYPTRIALIGLDLETNSRFVTYQKTGYGDVELGRIAESSAKGGAVAWSRYAYDQYKTAVLGAPLAEMLPSSPRPDPGANGLNWTYYAATGHFLSGGFRAFWEQSGGLPVFGYPLTEEFTQDWRTAQYFERQRFEWHPENAGTPYEVLLGQLGTEGAAQAGLLDTAPFQPVGENSSPAAGCQYFTETSHFACGSLVNYWRMHGLEFGDPGTSYRESLALFGYPISEPFVDPASGLTVQYFERAVFEAHPENAGTPFAVLLRRLGAGSLVERDWD